MCGILQSAPQINLLAEAPTSLEVKRAHELDVNLGRDIADPLRRLALRQVHTHEEALDAAASLKRNFGLLNPRV